MRTLTIKKEDFLYKYPDIFSKLVWVQGLCVINIWDEVGDNCVVSSAGAFGLIDIPKIALLKKCEQCGKPLSPRRKRFCCNKCKDRYHNIHNPRGYYAPGSEHNKEQVLRYPQTIREMVHFKSIMADEMAEEEDCGDHPRY